MVLWEPLEYIGEALVFIGVAGEVFAEWREPERKELAKASSMVLIIGLAFSLAALIGTNEHFNGTIADLNLKASQANERAARDEREIAGANEHAATADLARQKLASRMVKIFGIRSLNESQSADMARKLRGLKGVKVDVVVFAVENPYVPNEEASSRTLALEIVSTLRDRAHMDADGWLLEECSNGASNVVLTVPGKDRINEAIAHRIIKAFPADIGVDPALSPYSADCNRFSDLDTSKPNKRTHDAPIIITVGSKINPILTPEMLELPGERKKQETVGQLQVLRSRPPN